MAGEVLLVCEREVHLYRAGKSMNEAQYSVDVPTVLFCCVKIVF